MYLYSVTSKILYTFMAVEVSKTLPADKHPSTLERLWLAEFSCPHSAPLDSEFGHLSEKQKVAPDGSDSLVSFNVDYICLLVSVYKILSWYLLNWLLKPSLLWWTNILPWKITMFNGKIHYKWTIFNSYLYVHQTVKDVGSSDQPMPHGTVFFAQIWQIWGTAWTVWLLLGAARGMAWQCAMRRANYPLVMSK